MNSLKNTLFLLSLHYSKVFFRFCPFSAVVFEEILDRLRSVTMPNCHLISIYSLQSNAGSPIVIKLQPSLAEEKRKPWTLSFFLAKPLISAKINETRDKQRKNKSLGGARME